MMNRTRIPDNNRVRRDITIDKSARSNQNIISNDNLPDDRGIDTDTDTAADGRDPHPRPSAFRPDSHPFMQMTVVTQDGIPIHGDTVGVS